jgi:hypothetical protein
LWLPPAPIQTQVSRNLTDNIDNWFLRKCIYKLNIYILKRVEYIYE